MRELINIAKKHLILREIELNSKQIFDYELNGYRQISIYEELYTLKLIIQLNKSIIRQKHCI